MSGTGIPHFPVCDVEEEGACCDEGGFYFPLEYAVDLRQHMRRVVKVALL